MLTTEQKINLLILAGYAPVLTPLNDSWRAIERTNATHLPRMKMPGKILWQDSCGSWYVFRGSDYDHNTVDFIPCAWGECQVETVPDELIYEACDANH